MGAGGRLAGIPASDTLQETRTKMVELPSIPFKYVAASVALAEVSKSKLGNETFLSRLSEKPDASFLTDFCTNLASGSHTLRLCRMPVVPVQRGRGRQKET